MKTKEFFNLEQAQRYLNGSIIRLGEEPIVILDVDGKSNYNLVYREMLEKDTIKKIRLNHSNINMHPVHLGYCNINGFSRNVITTYRVPIRDWKIGLYSRNFRVEETNKNDKITNGIDLVSFLNSKNLYNTIKNIYPSFEEVLGLMKQYGPNKSTIAFNRNFLINSNMDIFHILFKTPIGKFKEKSFNLKENFSYLSEVLKEAINAN